MVKKKHPPWTSAGTLPNIYQVSCTDLWREIIFCWSSFITFFWRFIGWLLSEEMVYPCFGYECSWVRVSAGKINKLQNINGEIWKWKWANKTNCVSYQLYDIGNGWKVFCLLDCCMAWTNFTAHYLSWSLTNGKTGSIWPSVRCRKWYLVLQADCANDDGPTDGSTWLLTHPWGPYLWASPPSQKVNQHFQDTSVSDSFWFIF